MTVSNLSSYYYNRVTVGILTYAECRPCVATNRSYENRTFVFFTCLASRILCVYPPIHSKLKCVSYLHYPGELFSISPAHETRTFSRKFSSSGAILTLTDPKFRIKNTGSKTKFFTCTIFHTLGYQLFVYPEKSGHSWSLSSEIILLAIRSAWT